MNSVVFDKEGAQLFSADGHGIIKVWALEGWRTSKSAQDIESTDQDNTYRCITTINALQV